MSEVLEDEVSETFDLIERPKRIGLADLPRSPKSAFVAATACGWGVRAWLSIGEVPPVLYATDSEDGAKNPHAAGEVKFDGYTARLFTIEARDPDMPLGFRAHYLGKQYADPARTSSAGGFDYAMVVDPVGVPVELRATYKPIPTQRGKFETAKSFQERVDDRQKMADEMNADYNDGAIAYLHALRLTAGRQFDAWLAEWRSFASPTTKKATPNA